MYLNSLGGVLNQRYRSLGRLEDLEEAIKLVRQAVDLTPTDNLYRPIYLNSLGDVLNQRYQRLGRLEDLEESIKLFRDAHETSK
jgi:tetratricopeptide (TPR) repeat protein